MSAPALLSKLPVDHWFDASYLEEQGILPLEIAGDRLRIAVAGEPTSKVLQDLERSYGMPVDLVRVSEADLLKGIHQPAIRSRLLHRLPEDQHFAFRRWKMRLQSSDAAQQS